MYKYILYPMQYIYFYIWYIYKVPLSLPGWALCTFVFAHDRSCKWHETWCVSGVSTHANVVGCRWSWNRDWFAEKRTQLNSSRLRSTICRTGSLIAFSHSVPPTQVPHDLCQLMLNQEGLEWWDRFEVIRWKFILFLQCLLSWFGLMKVSNQLHLTKNKTHFRPWKLSHLAGTSAPSVKKINAKGATQLCPTSWKKWYW